MGPGNACVRSTQIKGRLCSRPTTIPLHKAIPGNAYVRSTQITESPLQSTDNDFSTQGGPWQCVRAFHTNNSRPTTISLHKVAPGNACVRSTQITGSPLQQRFLYTRQSLAMRACVPHK